MINIVRTAALALTLAAFTPVLTAPAAAQPRAGAALRPRSSPVTAAIGNALPF